MSPAIPPTVGRIVHYQPDQDDLDSMYGDGTVAEGDAPPHAALVVAVPDSAAQGRVSLRVHANEEEQADLYRPDVPYDESGGPGTWRWPPQVGLRAGRTGAVDG